MASTLLFYGICAIILYIIIKVFQSNEHFTHQPIDTSRPPIMMYGTNPIRQRSRPYMPWHYGIPRVWDSTSMYWDPYYQMYTSSYTDVCSRYGSSTLDMDASTFYTGSRWCPIGIVFNVESSTPGPSNQPHAMFSLEARFIANSWSFRIKDAISQVYIYLNTVGSGPYGAFRDNEVIQIPGKPGLWKIQIQTQQSPYLLSLPF